MRLRSYEARDLEALIALFRATVRSVNRRHYSAAQVEAWAPDRIDRATWARRLAAATTLVAEEDGRILGFASLTAAGCVDLLFVHKDHQRRGVASRLLAGLEAEAARRGLRHLVTEASITARPFFARQGFRLVDAQVVALRGQSLDNFRMEKPLDPDGTP